MAVGAEKENDFFLMNIEVRNDVIASINRTQVEMSTLVCLNDLYLDTGQAIDVGLFVYKAFFTVWTVNLDNDISHSSPHS